MARLMLEKAPRARCLALAGVIFCLGACGGPPVTAVGRCQQAIIEGAPASDERVVAIIENGTDAVTCSGILISSRVVLTAAHCASARPRQIRLGPSAVEGVLLAAVSASLHPSFSAETSAFDLGTVTLAEPAPIAAAAVALSAVPPQPGASLRFVGFGYSQVGARGEYGVRLGRSAVVTSVAAETFAYGVATCDGDSGGPATFIDGPLAGSLVGITSSGDAACARSGTDARVDRALDWVAAQVAAADPTEDLCLTGDPP